MTFVALLRGINVGGKNTVAMGRLRGCFAGLGFSGVKTYINSGNVIFSTGKASPRDLEASIESGLEKEFRFPIRVLVRSLSEMGRVVRSIPSGWAGSKDLRCNVIFLGPAIDKPSILKGLRPKAGIDTVFYRKGALFWSAPIRDLTRSGMPRIAGLPIYKEMTIRSVSTTRKVYDLMRDAAEEP